MAVKVVDASIVAAMVFGEPDVDLAAGLMRGARLAAPRLLPYELANICVTKCRRRQERRDMYLAALATFAGMDVDLRDVDHDAAARLAERRRLTAYDASYLWLADDLDAELLTFDRRLAAARDSGRAQ